ncbi:MAG: tetratricopeptide repeat protein [Micromonosporaceae bacterium]|nr:tetratricopeptide repeat protein [Micromonosporaceae bacterium]
MQHDEAPDPSQVRSTVEFVRQLRLLKVWAGDPSYDELRRRTGLARSTLFDGLSLKRARLPSLDLVRRFVTACGCDADELVRWEAAWRRLRSPAASEDPRQQPRAPAHPAEPHGPAPRQLPAEAGGFVGRVEELARLDAVTGPDGPRSLVVISGVAGVGKTALAVRWARQAADHFADGQLYVDLRGHALASTMTAAQALSLLLAALGVPESQLPVSQDALAGRYRSVTAGRRLLVVLDNAATAAQVRPLLPGGQDCAVVVTSRSALSGLAAREGAAHLRLGVLDEAESHWLLREAVGSDRVAAEPAAAEDLARLCGRLPLALRIAAAQIAERADRSIAAYASELTAGDRLAGLAADGDDETAVRAAFDLSYGTLRADARLLFRRLGLAPGPSIGADAAAVLAGIAPEDASRLLGVLSDVHLVEAAGSGEHRMHDLVRLYARQRAQRDDSPLAATEAVSRLLQWYAASARAAGELVAPTVSHLPMPDPPAGVPSTRFADRDDALEWLERQRGNLMAAVEHAARRELWPMVLRLADGIRGFLHHRGYRADWLAAVHRGLDAARRAADEAGEAAMHMSAGLAHWSAGDPQHAVEHYDRCLELQRKLGNRVGEAGTLGNLALAYHSLGRAEEAISYHRESLAASRRIGDRDREADALNNFGFLCCELARLDEAAESLEAARRLYRELGRPEREAGAEVNLGLVRHEQGRLADALRHQRRAMDLANRTGRGVLAEIMVNLAATYRDLGRYEQAVRYARRALTAAGESGDKVVEATALNACGGLLRLRGEPEQAAPHHDRALTLATQMGNPREEAEALLGLAESGVLAGAGAGAVRHAERAVEIARAAPAMLLGRALVSLSRACLDAGEPGVAAARAAEAVEECRRRGQRLTQARALLALGRAQAAAGEREAARRSWSEGVEAAPGEAPEAQTLRELLSGAE